MPDPQTTDVSRSLYLAVAILLRPDGRMLLVRKRGTTLFMQPGGKVEEGEAPAQALQRELWEELALETDPATYRYCGCATAMAANEPGWRVCAEVYRVDTHGQVALQAEIEEGCWVDATAQLPPLAPLTEDSIFPLYLAMRRGMPPG